ncbi:carbohydrate kinase family protein [Galbibacter sp.]|jgi:sugar/nucleoside kinase (ribokinase family)|uniref:carbohydrate kinase family protein n=1 Tax=Galbibacter sp. TaxID=2918471 RepID=UPI003A8E9C6B
MPTKELLVIGELNVDLILNQIDGFPKIGTEILANKMNLTLGSSSAIMAANASAIGVDTYFCGLIGTDDFGSFILNSLESKGVGTEFIQKTSEHQSGITVVMSYEQDRANVTYCGAMEALTYAKIPWGDLKGFKHLHLSNFFIQKGIRQDIVKIFEKAKSLGLTTSLDLQWDPDNLWDFDYKNCLKFVDIFMPNEAELMALTKKKNLDQALEVIAPYANTSVIKQGDKGSLAVANGTRISAAAFTNDNPIDTIGAGDSFNSGFIKKYIDGSSLEDCLHYGNLMGALSTTAAGGTAAFSNLDAIKETLKEKFNSEY